MNKVFRNERTSLDPIAVESIMRVSVPLILFKECLNTHTIMDQSFSQIILNGVPYNFYNPNKYTKNFLENPKLICDKGMYIIHHYHNYLILAVILSIQSIVYQVQQTRGMKGVIFPSKMIWRRRKLRRRKKKIKILTTLPIIAACFETYFAECISFG